MKKPRMTNPQLSCGQRLLWMEYKPSELAKEVGISTDWVYKSAMPAGCPHRKDETGQVWIVGTEFAQWAKEIFKRTPVKLEDGQAYCMKCKRPAQIVNETVKPISAAIEMVVGQCAVCGTQVHRARKTNHGQS